MYMAYWDVYYTQFSSHHTVMRLFHWSNTALSQMFYYMAFHTLKQHYYGARHYLWFWVSWSTFLIFSQMLCLIICVFYFWHIDYQSTLCFIRRIMSPSNPNCTGLWPLHLFAVEKIGNADSSKMSNHGPSSSP